MVGGIGGTSIFTLNPDAKREPEIPPHERKYIFDLLITRI